MHPLEVVLVLLGVAVALGVLAKRLGVPYPVLLVAGGLVLSLQPGVPGVALDPSVVMLGFLPPLLYAAAFDTHWPAFRRQLRAISLLAVGLVLFTTTLVAVAAHEWVGLPWGPAFVLGAIVSPPDAVAAVAVTRQVRVPRIVVTILEGESLVNDATALVAYRIALGAVAYGAFSLWDAGAQFALVSAGGVAVGVAGAWLVIRVHRWLTRTGLGDAKVNISLTLLTPYAVYLPAEHLHVSGVLAVVAAGLWVGSRCEQVFTPELYAEARAVWQTAELVLNGLIFILIGFQLPVILGELQGDYTPGQLLGFTALIAGVVVATRLAWVFPGAYVPRWADRRVFGSGDPYPPWRWVAVAGWAGMRGVVSLAAALAIPRTAGGGPFPGRDLIQFVTFGVIFVTLVGQGLTLPLLIRALGVDRDADTAPDPSERASC